MLSGLALDEAGRVLAGVEILVARRGGEAQPRRGSTDAAGRFLFASLPEKAGYLLVGTKAGYLAAIAQVPALPAHGIKLLLRPVPAELARDMTWVLRLPGRDLLRSLGEDQLLGELLHAEPAAGVPLSAQVEQRLGVSMAAGLLPAASAPDVGTRLVMTGQAASGLAWHSDASFTDTRLAKAAGSRRTEEMALAGGATMDLGQGFQLESSARVLRQRLDLGQGPRDNHGAGVDLEARLPQFADTKLWLHLRELSASAAAAGPDRPALDRRAAGVSYRAGFGLGLADTLEASLDLRAITGDTSGVANLGAGAARPGESYWLVPQGSWGQAAVQHRLHPAATMELAYGARVVWSASGEAVWVPGIDLLWSPAPRTTLTTSLGWRAGEAHPQSPRVAPALLVELQLVHHLNGTTRVGIGARQQDLALRDPLGVDGWSASGAAQGVWTDGAAVAREAQLFVDQDLGPVRARLVTEYGRWKGNLAVPDPFALYAARLENGEATYRAIRAAAALPATNTEISVGLSRLSSAADDDIRIVGLRFSQGLPALLRVPGEWRLLLDYEGIGGGRPFAVQMPGSASAASPTTSVARVTGGIAVRF